MTTPDAEFDARVRDAIASSIRSRGAVPTIAQVSADLREREDVVRASFDRMIAAHVFIAKRGSSEILSYNPFAAEPTDFRVRSAGREWWALCGWDALGVPAALRAAGTIESSCSDCGEPIRIDVRADGTATTTSDVVLRIGVRAIDFWKDIYVT